MSVRTFANLVPLVASVCGDCGRRPAASQDAKPDCLSDVLDLHMLVTLCITHEQLFLLLQEKCRGV